jgi:hypothetical protein
MAVSHVVHPEESIVAGMWVVVRDERANPGLLVGREAIHREVRDGGAEDPLRRAEFSRRAAIPAPGLEGGREVG